MSQQYAGTYMDGVPVKISEKYKPPPPISVPSGLFERVASIAAHLQDGTRYDFTLEHNVVRKLDEWRNARETIRNERNHRIQLREEARQRELDQIAANETEERLKQLSVSEVSYPSTEEISEISPDDCVRTEQPNESISAPTEPEHLDESSNIITDIRNVYAEKNKCDETINILKPIPAPLNGLNSRVNLLDDLDPIMQYQLSSKIKSNKYIRPGTFYDKSVVDKLSFSDFENDTSSPFDNLELKTMNDLELLAQVLNTQTSANAVNENTGSYKDISIDQKQSYVDVISVAEPINTNVYMSEQIISHSGASGCDYFSPVSSYGTSNSYIGAVNTMPMNNSYFNEKFPTYINNSGVNNDYYASNYGYPVTNTPYQNISNINNYETVNKDSARYGEAIKSNVDINFSGIKHSNFNQVTNDPYKLYNSNYSSYIPINDTNVYEQNTSNYSQNAENETYPSAQSLIRSRSRSVPDIVKELDDEVAGARMKSRERSHNCSPSPLITNKPDVPLSRLPNKENLPNPFDNLSPRLQLMCKNISGMGFPIERVARACDNIGEDDKKIIEYLLIMGQLMDLGFMESKVAKALLQHNCNRDKALDELIS